MTAAEPLSRIRPSSQPRARGLLRVEVRVSDGRSIAGRVHQAGASKVVWPRTDADFPTGVILNTAGGVTGGDRFELSSRVETGARLTLTTQTAERIYRAVEGEAAQVRTHLTVAAGARIDWLPQETILFDRLSLDRRLRVDLDPGARCLLVEPLVLGRQAMGEAVRQGRFRDRIEIRRGGRLVLADAIRMEGDVAGSLKGRATMAGGVASAGIVLAGPEAESFIAPLRDMLPETCGVSLVRPGILFARLVAPDSYVLRQTLIPAAERLHGRALPRTWTI